MVALREMADTPIGDRIRLRREAVGMSQKELAFAARVPRTWLTNVENGVVHYPRVDRLLRVARALNVSMESLLEDTSDRTVRKELTPDEDNLIETIRGFLHVSVRRISTAVSAMYRADDELFDDLSGAKDEQREAERRRLADTDDRLYEP